MVEIENVVITGSKEEFDFEVVKNIFETEINEYIPDCPCITVKQISFINAYNIEKMAKDLADMYNINTKEFEPNWDKYGKSACYKERMRMIKSASFAIILWDGKYNETKKIIKELKKLEIRTVIYNFRENKKEYFKGFWGDYKTTIEPRTTIEFSHMLKEPKDKLKYLPKGDGIKNLFFNNINKTILKVTLSSKVTWGLMFSLNYDLYNGAIIDIKSQNGYKRCMETKDLQAIAERLVLRGILPNQLTLFKRDSRFVPKKDFTSNKIFLDGIGFKTIQWEATEYLDDSDTPSWKLYEIYDSARGINGYTEKRVVTKKKRVPTVLKYDVRLWESPIIDYKEHSKELDFIKKYMPIFEHIKTEQIDKCDILDIKEEVLGFVLPLTTDTNKTEMFLNLLDRFTFDKWLDDCLPDIYNVFGPDLFFEIIKTFAENLFYDNDEYFPIERLCKTRTFNLDRFNYFTDEDEEDREQE